MTYDEARVKHKERWALAQALIRDPFYLVNP